MATHTTTPYRWITSLLEAKGSGRRGPLWQCPAHVDPGPSLAVSEVDGHVRLRCFAGCETPAVARALGVPMRYLYRAPSICPERFAANVSRATFPPVAVEDHTAGQGMRLESEHPYGNPSQAWLMRYRHPVTGAKRCVWESLNGRGERVPGLLGRELDSLPLYQERDAIAAVALGDAVAVVESESSVDALRRAGVVAVTWAGGAGRPDLAGLRRVLGGHRRTVVFADADDAGRRCAQQVCRALPLAQVHVPKTEGEDARDAVQQLGPEAFRRLVNILVL